MALVLTSLVSIATQPRTTHQTAIHKINLLDSTATPGRITALPGERFSLGPETHANQPASQPTATQQTRASGDALRIFLDAQGRPTVPSPSRLAAEQSALRPLSGKTPVKKQPVIEKSPVKGGGEYARLDGRFRGATVATVNANGSISLHEQAQATGLSGRRISQSSLAGLTHE